MTTLQYLLSDLSLVAGCPDRLEAVEAKQRELDARVTELEQAGTIPVPSPPPPSSGGILLYEDFSTYLSVDDLTFKDRIIMDAPPGHSWIVNAQTADARLRCKIAKDQPLNPKGHCKSEFRFRDKSVDWKKSLCEPFNVRRWYTWTVCMYTPWAHDPHKTHLMDFHGQPDEGEGGRHPNITAIAQDNEWRVKRAWDDELGNIFKDEPYRGPLEPLGGWVEFCVEAIWSHESKGMIRLWLNDLLMAEVVNVPTAFHDEEGPYLKLGLYVPALSAKYDGQYEDDFPDGWEHVVDFGAIKIGDERFSSKEEFLSAQP